MDKSALKDAQDRFLKRYPGGFDNPELVAMGKKYKMAQHCAFARERFAQKSFDSPQDIVEAMAQLASKSAMVSMFEKPKLKAAVAELDHLQSTAWADALRQLLHGDQQSGFEALVAALSQHKLAKWTLVSLVPCYYAPDAEVFVKPTTAKLVIEKLGLDLKYSAKPNWEFYERFRAALLQMRRIAKRVRAPDNAAFSGFLMMELSDWPGG